jgi:hypothetical protein
MRSSLALTLALAALTALAAACGGDDDDGTGPGTGPVTPAQAEAGCGSDCEHSHGCDATVDVAACTADCVSDVTAGWFRADAFDAIVACRTGLACGADDDACLEACRPTLSHDAYEAQCREVFAGCGTQAQIDSVCEVTPSAVTGNGVFCLITPSIIDEMTACIPDGTGCSGVECIAAVAEAHGIDL